MAGKTQTKQSIPAPTETEKTVFSLLRKKIDKGPLAQTIRNEQEVREEKGPSIRQALDAARIQELTFKHFFRISFSIFSAGLLLWQNYEVFSVIDQAFATHQLKDLQLIFAALIGATLTETYFILRIIVNFVFSFSDYKYDKP